MFDQLHQHPIFLLSLLSFLWLNPPFTFSSFTFSDKVSDGMQAVQFTKEPYTALGQLVVLDTNVYNQ